MYVFFIIIIIIIIIIIGWRLGDLIWKFHFYFIFFYKIYSLIIFGFSHETYIFLLRWHAYLRESTRFAIDIVKRGSATGRDFETVSAYNTRPYTAKTATVGFFLSTNSFHLRGLCHKHFPLLTNPHTQNT